VCVCVCVRCVFDADAQNELCVRAGKRALRRHRHLTSRRTDAAAASYLQQTIRGLSL